MAIDESPLAAPGAGFSRILVPTDLSAPSLKALSHALALSTGEVKLFHVVEPLRAGAESRQMPVPGPEAPASPSLVLKRIVAEHAVPEVQLTPEVAAGSPGDEIVRRAAGWPADLLVLSTHGRAGVAHWIAGSVAETVLRHAPCPLLLLRKHQRGFVSGSPGERPRAALRRLLVPIDFSPRSRAALPWAAALAARFASEIVLLHCVHLDVTFCTGTFPELDTVELCREAVGNARRELEKLLPPLAAAGVRGRGMVVEGCPLDEILRAAREGDFDLVVTSTHAGAPVRHALLGSLAEQLVRHAACPVLIVPSPEP